jgi:DNA-binding NarL/FixJ family response regulator
MAEKRSIGNKSIGEAYGLTCGEQAVLDSMLRDDSDGNIAQQLRISETTVRLRRRTIMRKLNVTNHGDVIERVRQWDLAVSRLLSVEQG